MSIILGIDYASIDGNAAPNWALAKTPSSDGSRLRFVGIRASYGDWSDTTCIRDWAGIKAAGLKRLPYLYPRYKDSKGVLLPIEDQVMAARIALDKGGGLEPGVDYPVAIDIESGGGPKELSPADRLAWYRALWQLASKVFGAVSPLYTSARVWREDLGNLPAPDMAAAPSWFAKPWPWPVSKPGNPEPVHRDGPAGRPEIPSPWATGVNPTGNWGMYQRQGDGMGWPGFTHTVDVDIFNPCRRGDKGTRVAQYQRKLGVAAVDGDFGPKTQAAVELFQVKHNLDADGVIGPDTDAPLCWVLR